MMHTRLQLPLIHGIVLVIALSLASAQTSSEWKIDYHESGGIDGRVLSITLTSPGKADSKGGLGPGAWQSTFQISSGQLSEVRALVNDLKLSGTPTRRPAEKRDIPDMVYTTLDVTHAGAVYPILSPPPKLVAILRDLLKQGKKQAEDEKWQKAGDFKLGRVWHVSEEVRDKEGIWHGELWQGTWTRKGDGKIFDAVWVNNQTHQEVHDTVELDSAERGWFMLHRTSSNISYKGYYQADKQNDLVGYVSSCPTCTWRTQIEY